MTDQHDMQHPEITESLGDEQRRTFLRGLGKWSQAVIGGVLLGGAGMMSPSAQANSWVNRRGGGGGWVNRSGGGWVNHSGGGWVNRSGGWVNRGGGGWVNRRGGSSAGWINR